MAKSTTTNAGAQKTGQGAVQFGRADPHSQPIEATRKLIVVDPGRHALDCSLRTDSWADSAPQSIPR